MLIAALLALISVPASAAPAAPFRTVALQNKDDVRALAVSADGKRLATVSKKDLCVWALPSHELIGTQPLDLSGLPKVWFSPDGALVAVEEHDEDHSQTLFRIFSVAPGRLAESRQLVDRISAISPDWRYSAYYGDVFEGLAARKLFEQSDSFEAFGPNQAAFLSGGVEIALHSLPDGKERARFHLPVANFGMISYSPDGRLLVVADSDDGEAAIVNAADGSVRGRLHGLAPVYTGGPVFSPKGAMVAAELKDGGLGLFDVTGRLVRTLASEHDFQPQHPQFSPDGSVVYGEYGTAVEGFRTDDGSPVDLGPRGGIGVLAVSPDSRRLVAAFVSDIRVIDLATGRVERTLATPEASIIAFSGDGKQLAAAGAKGAIDLWNPVSGAKLRSFPAPSDSTFENAASLSFSPDGRRLLASYGHTNATLWDLDSGDKIKDLGFIADAAMFLADGKHVLVNSAFGRGVAVYNADTGVKVRAFDGANPSAGMALSRDEKRLASVEQFNGTLGVWDAESTEQLKTKQLTVDLDNGIGPDMKPLGSSTYPDFGRPAFSPDGRRIYILGRDRLRAFDASTLAELPVPDVPHFDSEAGVMDGETLIMPTHDGKISKRSQIGLWRTGYGSAPEPARAARAVRPPKRPRRTTVGGQARQ